jgi:hypothetical protein
MVPIGKTSVAKAEDREVASMRAVVNGAMQKFGMPIIVDLKH